MFLDFNLVYFFFIIYIQHYPKLSYIKYYQIICTSTGNLLVEYEWQERVIDITKLSSNLQHKLLSVSCILIYFIKPLIGVPPTCYHNYPIVENTGTASPPPETEESNWHSDSTTWSTSSDLSLNTTTPNG